MFHGGVLLLLVVVVVLSGSAGALSVPDVLCLTEDDCRFGGWTLPLPDCVEGRCRCPADTCTVYTTGSRNYLFFCGSCGTLGSECNSSMECDGQWECESNFCVCDRGEVIREMCVFFRPVPTSVSNLVLILILAVLLILHKLISSKRTLCMCCCKRSNDTEGEGTRVVAYNPSSGEKTAAYTITHSEFMVTSDDPDLEWALELSREAWGRGEVWLPMAESTWSSRASSALPEDLRRISSRGGGLPPEHPPPTASSSTGSSHSSEPGTSGWRPRSSSSFSSSSSPTASVASEDQRRRRHRRSTRSSTSSALSTSTPLPPPPPPSSSFSSSFSCPRSSSLSFSSSTTCSHSTSPSSSSSSSCQRSWSVSHAPHFSAAASLPPSASCCGSVGREEHLTDTRL